MITKEAGAAKSILKGLGYTALGGTALAGAGYGGHKIGFKRGAEETSDAMTNAFMTANQKENKAIRNSFNAFNKKENRVIAHNFMRQGMALGAHLPSQGKIKIPKEMKKAASFDLEAIYNNAVDTELDKIAGKYKTVA